jgi:uncharacterized protein (DUF433 family)
MVGPTGVELLRGGILPSCVVESETNDRLKTMEMFPGISMDPDVRFGKPCITGTRIDVATLVGAVAAGETVETVADEYALTIEQVRSALGYAAHVAAHLPPAVRQAS